MHDVHEHLSTLIVRHRFCIIDVLSLMNAMTRLENDYLPEAIERYVSCIPKFHASCVGFFQRVFVQIGVEECCVHDGRALSRIAHRDTRHPPKTSFRGLFLESLLWQARE